MQTVVVVVRARTALLLLLLLTGLLLAACGVAASGNQPGNLTGDLTGSQTGAAVDGAAGGGPAAAGAASSGADPAGSDPAGSAPSGSRCTIASGSQSQDCTPSAPVVTVRGRAATSVPARQRSAGPTSGLLVRTCAIVVRAGAPTPTGCPVAGPTKGPLPVPGTSTVPLTGPPTYPGGCSPLFFGTPPGPVSSGWTCPAPTYRDCYVNGVLTACPPVPVSEPPSATRYPTGTAPS